ncbi:MAG: transporter substrate-binding domain-containing protein [Pseudomonadales bacterium]|nr:transporter substrate-binding domain-containing protein [Pseudomonadales bacterium]
MLIAICMSATSLGSYARPVLTLTTPDITSYYFHTDDHQGLGDKVLKEALSRIGYDLKVVPLPAERSLLMADSGGVDGELLRTRAIEQRFPDLVRVSESLLDVEFVVFSLQSASQIEDWASLKNKSVAVIIGMKIIEENIPESALVTRVNKASQLFDMIKNGRVQYAAFVRDIGDDFIKHHGVTGILASQSTLSAVPTYTYLHKKHRDLVPKLAQSLREMKNDGTFRAIVENHQP